MAEKLKRSLNKIKFNSLAFATNDFHLMEMSCKHIQHNSNAFQWLCVSKLLKCREKDSFRYKISQ